MNNIEMYIVDAFSKSSFRGNTCAVCIFPDWPDDTLLQDIAKQNLFAETAFIVQRDDNPELRWFTVSQEVDFCGYGTLSAGYVYLNHLDSQKNKVVFSTRKYGLIPVQKIDSLFSMSVPVKHSLDHVFSDAVYNALGGVKPETMITTSRGDLMIVYQAEDDVHSISPDFLKLMKNDFYGYVLTSPSLSADYAYRYFSPRMTDVWEDPVNGASQSVLAPYWAKRLGKEKLHGKAISKRGGDIFCEYHGNDIVVISGHVTPYLQGRIFIPK